MVDTTPEPVFEEPLTQHDSDSVAAEKAEPVKKEEVVVKKPSQPECKKETLFGRIVKKLFG